MGTLWTDNFLTLLASLNQIGSAINRISPGDNPDARAALQLIVKSATQVVPDASAVLYTFDAVQDQFESDSRVSAGERLVNPAPDEPRPHGIGMRAIRQRRRVLSYEEPDLIIHPVLAQMGGAGRGLFPAGGGRPAGRGAVHVPV